MTSVAIVLLLGLGVVPQEASAADKLVGIYAARVMSQSSPWIAQEAGLFAKHALSFELKFRGLVRDGHRGDAQRRGRGGAGS